MSANDKVCQSDDADKEIRRVCSILESIAKNYTPCSDEAAALEDAALAYIAVQQQANLEKQYSRLRLACGGNIPGEMKARLWRHGIEPDDLDDDKNGKRK
jgi:hypothetical protein